MAVWRTRPSDCGQRERRRENPAALDRGRDVHPFAVEALERLVIVLRGGACNRRSLLRRKRLRHRPASFFPACHRAGRLLPACCSGADGRRDRLFPACCSGTSRPPEPAEFALVPSDLPPGVAGLMLTARLSCSGGLLRLLPSRVLRSLPVPRLLGPFLRLRLLILALSLVFSVLVALLLGRPHRQQSRQEQCGYRQGYPRTPHSTVPLVSEWDRGGARSAVRRRPGRRRLWYNTGAHDHQRLTSGSEPVNL